MTDLSKNATTWALYLPAISGFYINTYKKGVSEPEYFGDRIPKGLDKGIEGLNFLEKGGYFYYPFGLYSAGHAELNVAKATIKEPMIHQRDRENTILIGDSGGFQIATGVLKIDWSKFKEAEGDKLRGDILTWLENTSDWSMTLDVPGFAASEPFTKKTGLTKFEDTLDFSLVNLHYFMKHRTPGKTKFLNVLSGSTNENTKAWYEEVKKFSMPDEVEKMGYDRDRTLEGFAMAGRHANNMYITLTRILDLIEDGLIEGKDWMHFLGLGRLDWACFITALQRELRKHYNPNIQLSFDAASPFVATAYGQCYQYNMFSPKKFMYFMSPAPDNKKFDGMNIPMPYLSPIMDKLTLSDMCPLSVAHAIIDGEHRYDVTKEEVEELVKNGVNVSWQEEKLNKIGKSPRTSWDTLSYLLFMGHNVYKHIEAVQEANRVADVEYERLKPNWRDWTKDKKTSGASEISEIVPHTVLYFRSFIEELLDPATPNPRELLDSFRPFIDSVSFGGVKNNIFDDLFEFETGAEPDIDKFADMNDEKLLDLENQVKE